MATLQELEAAIRAADAAGNADDVRALVAAYRAAQQPQETYDPTEGMAEWQKAAAGVGKAIVDTGRGLGQLVGLVSQEEVDAAKQRDAALMDTGAGLTGNIVGNVGMALAPGGALKGATMIPRLAQLLPRTTAALGVSGQTLLAPRTVIGAAGVGAGQGFVQPVASDESRAFNTLLGTAGGAAPQAAIATARTAKALIDPYLASGRNRIAGDVLRRFAGDDVTKVLAADTTPLVPGTRPDLAEVVSTGVTGKDAPGVASLKQLLLNNPDAGPRIENAMRANQDVRLKAIRDLAGPPGQRQGYVDSREYVSDFLYKQAFAQQPAPTPWIKGELTKLEKRPAFREAWANAKEVAANRGIDLGDANDNNITQFLHFTKMSLDNAIDKANRAGGDVQGLLDTKRKLVSLMESKNFAPAYRQARQAYADMSKPINKLDVGEELGKSLEPAFAEFGARRITPQKFASAVADLDTTAQKATGFSGARADQIYDPTERQAIENVVRDLARSANSMQHGIAGSPTSKYILGNDVLEQIAGPLGIPGSWATSALAENFLAKPLSFLNAIPQDRVQKVLADMMLDPEKAKKLLQAAVSRQSGTALDRGLPYLTPAMIGVANTLE